jgi:hypothetical protein
MKLKISTKVRPLLSKHFITRLPKICFPIGVTAEQFLAFWDKCPMVLKRNSLVFFDKELIEFVN